MWPDDDEPDVPPLWVQLERARARRETVEEYVGRPARWEPPQKYYCPSCGQVRAAHRLRIGRDAPVTMTRHATYVPTGYGEPCEGGTPDPEKDAVP